MFINGPKGQFVTLYVQQFDEYYWARRQKVRKI